ncbi:MAG: AAA family ATPase [Rhodoferax sp.]|uniref:AAA family ATPase n=1 Tax=Rhodoferax sp. TaxID=50421 RepID=UPI0032673DC1
MNTEIPIPSTPAIARHVQRRIATALQDTRVVLVVGPRQAGKTTLARLYANSGRPYLTLDDPATLAAARAHPICCWPSRKAWTKTRHPAAFY